VLGIEEPKQGLEEKNVCVKEEKSEIDKQLVIYQTTDAAPAENVLTTPSMVECRFVCHVCTIHICYCESCLLCNMLNSNAFCSSQTLGLSSAPKLQEKLQKTTIFNKIHWTSFSVVQLTSSSKDRHCAVPI
jgi:Cft2 family RNA processing exonuclease